MYNCIHSGTNIRNMNKVTHGKERLRVVFAMVTHFWEALELYTGQLTHYHPQLSPTGKNRSEKLLLPRLYPDSLDSLVFSPRLFQGKSRMASSWAGAAPEPPRPWAAATLRLRLRHYTTLWFTPELRPPLVMLNFESLSSYFLDCIDWYLIWCFIARNMHIIFHSRNLTFNFLISLKKSSKDHFTNFIQKTINSILRGSKRMPGYSRLVCIEYCKTHPVKTFLTSSSPKPKVKQKMEREIWTLGCL